MTDGSESSGGDIDLPPCWKESNMVPGEMDRLFVHLDGPGFIGVEDGTAELVTADIARGEDPAPETREATPEAVRDFAEQYNNEFYGEDNRYVDTNISQEDTPDAE